MLINTTLTVVTFHTWASWEYTASQGRGGTFASPEIENPEIENCNGHKYPLLLGWADAALAFPEPVYRLCAEVCGFLIFSCGKSAQLKGQKEALLKQKGKTTSGPKMYSWEGTVLGEGRDKGGGGSHWLPSWNLLGSKADLSKPFGEKK